MSEAPSSRHPTGDMLMDFLALAGELPEDYGPDQKGNWPPLPKASKKAAKRFCDTLEGSEARWLEAHGDMASWCAIVDDSERAGHLGLDELDQLPGLEDYPWHKRGPLWYSSGLSINGTVFGSMLFMRDGVVAVSPEDESEFTLWDWYEFPSHQWPLKYPTGEVRRGDLRLGPITIDHHAIGYPEWGEFSLRFAGIVLDRIHPIMAQSFGPFILKHPTGTWSEELVRQVMAGTPDREL